MDEIGHVARIQLWGEPGSAFGAVNYITLIMTWVVMALIITGAAVIVRRLKPVPGRVQFLIEALARFFDNLVKDALNREDRAFLPLIGSLFVYLLASNWIGVIPGLEEPTRDVNTPLSLGIMGFFIWHVSGMRTKGVFGYIKEFFQPIFFMFPLNAVGEIAKVISISFRLFGNIMGGAIIIIVVSHLLCYLVIPIVLNGFFGMFVGTVQAFVFTMLYLTYTSVAIRQE